MISIDPSSVSLGLVIGFIGGWIIDNVLPYHYKAWQDSRTERRKQRIEWYREAAQIGSRAQSVWNRPLEGHVKADSKTHAEISRIADRLDEMRYESKGVDDEVREAVEALADECRTIEDKMEMLTDAEPLVRPSKTEHASGTVEHSIAMAIDLGAELETSASKHL